MVSPEGQPSIVKYEQHGMVRHTLCVLGHMLKEISLIDPARLIGGTS